MSSHTVPVPCPAGVTPRRRALDLRGADDFYVGRTILKDGLGAYEPEVFAVLNALVERAGPSAHFLDIGANIGIFSLTVAALHDARVTAFEPMPELAAFVRDVSARNELPVEVQTCALSREDGVATFYLSSQSDTSNSLNRRFRPHRDSMEVLVQRLDTLFAESTDAFVIKVDTESTEPDVLHGGLQLIERHRPPIVCEVLAGRNEAELAQFFDGLGYVCVHLTDAPRWEGEAAVVGDAEYVFRDWLFLPDPADEALRDSFDRWYAVFRSS